MQQTTAYDRRMNERVRRPVEGLRTFTKVWRVICVGQKVGAQPATWYGCLREAAAITNGDGVGAATGTGPGALALNQLWRPKRGGNVLGNRSTSGHLVLLSPPLGESSFWGCVPKASSDSDKVPKLTFPEAEAKRQGWAAKKAFFEEKQMLLHASGPIFSFDKDLNTAKSVFFSKALFSLPHRHRRWSGQL